MDRHDHAALVAPLTRVPEAVAALSRRDARIVDPVAAMLLILTSFVGLLVQHRLGHADTLVFCVVLPAPLTLRRVEYRLPIVIIAGLELVQWLTSTPQIADGAVLIALLRLALEGTSKELVVAAVVVEAGAIMAALRWSPADPVRVGVGISGLAVAAAALGLAIRERQALVQAAAERTAALELERDQEGQRGAAAERARIAREMHDIVSHNLTVMVGLADGAAYVLESAPEDAHLAMTRVSATGRQALDEMRRLLGVLARDPGPQPYEPQPGLASLDGLLARVESAGLAVTLAVHGDLEDLSAGVGLTVFRVIQEALTNTLKHAGPSAEARVELARRGSELSLEVTDSGPTEGVGAWPSMAPRPVGGGLGRPSGGRGLTGMAERAAAHGGRLEAGPRAQGGWRVHLSLSSLTRAPEISAASSASPTGSLGR